MVVKLGLRVFEKRVLTKYLGLRGSNVWRVLVGQSEGIRPLGRPRHKWNANIKMEFQDMG